MAPPALVACAEPRSRLDPISPLAQAERRNDVDGLPCANGLLRHHGVRRGSMACRGVPTFLSAKPQTPPAIASERCRLVLRIDGLSGRSATSSIRRLAKGGCLPPLVDTVERIRRAVSGCCLSGRTQTSRRSDLVDMLGGGAVAVVGQCDLSVGVVVGGVGRSTFLDRRSTPRRCSSASTAVARCPSSLRTGRRPRGRAARARGSVRRLRAVEGAGASCPSVDGRQGRPRESRLVRLVCGRVGRGPSSQLEAVSLWSCWP